MYPSHKLALIILFGMTFLVLSCQNNTNTPTTPPKTTATKVIDYNKVAMELCDCMTPMVELYEEITTATQNNQPEVAKALTEQFRSMSEEGQDCAMELEAKYGPFTPEDERKAETAFSQACPTVINLLGGVVNE